MRSLILRGLFTDYHNIESSLNVDHSTSIRTSYETYQHTDFFESLDGIRFLAIFGVIWFHTHSRLLSSVVVSGRAGLIGVQLFFALSGFLITTLLLREKRNNHISLRNFYVRRLLRIVPIYYVVLLVYILLVFLVERDSLEGRAFMQHLPYFLTYASNWLVVSEGRIIFSFTWALAAIMQFYVAWPPIERYLKGIWPVVILLVMLVFLVCVQQHLFDTWVSTETLVYRIMSSIPRTIYLGALLAHLLDNQLGFELARKLLGQRWSSGVLVVVLIGFLFLPWASPLLTSCAVVLFVGCCVIRKDHILSPLLEFWLIRKIGVVSYGMYLQHMLVFNALKYIYGPLHIRLPLWYFVGTFIGTVLIAKLSHRYFEVYFLRLKGRFSRREGYRLGRHTFFDTCTDP